MTVALEPGRFEKRVVGTLVKALFFRGRRAGPWPVPATLPHVKVRFRGNSGARLVGLHFTATQPRGIVVLAHPDRRYGKQWFIREGWVEWLLVNGFDALAFDFPVYGESHGGSTYLHDDVAAACRLARRLRPDVPVHVIGLSIGAFAAANAAPGLDFVESLVMESPYPTFEAWYSEAGGKGTAPAQNRLLGRLFPKTYRRIDAGANIGQAKPRRILVAGTREDEVTAIELTRKVAAAAPTDRTEYLELDGCKHLELFRDPRYRQAVLATLIGTAAKPATEPTTVPAATVRTHRAYTRAH